MGRRRCCFYSFLSPDPPLPTPIPSPHRLCPSARLENPQEGSRWEAGLVCCPVLSRC